MHFTTFILVIAFGIVQVLAGASCVDRHVIESTKMAMPDGVVVTMEKFNCSNSVPAPRGFGLERREALTPLRNKRAASQCTTANCDCGIPCFFQGCGPVSEPVNGADCMNLANTLMNNPGTFSITPPVGVAFILETCTYSFLGPTVPTEYCFDDMGAAALELFRVCGASQQGSCGGSSGATEFFINQISL